MKKILFLFVFVTSFMFSTEGLLIEGNTSAEIKASISDNLKKLNEDDRKKFKEILSGIFYNMVELSKKEANKKGLLYDPTSVEYGTNIKFSTNEKILNFFNGRTFPEIVFIYNYFLETENPLIFNDKKSVYSEKKINAKNIDELSSQIVDLSKNLDTIDRIFLKIILKNELENNKIDKNIENKILKKFNNKTIKDILDTMDESNQGEVIENENK